MGKIEIMVTNGNLIVDDFIPCFHCTCAEMAFVSFRSTFWHPPLNSET